MCCTSLRTTGLVIGWLESIYTLLGLVNLFSILVTETNVELLTTFGIFFAIVAIKFICSVLLIVGTKKNRHLLLVPWLIFAAIGQAGLLGLLIWVAVEAPESATQEIMSILMAFILNPIISYAIFSLYKQIRTINGEQRPGNLEFGNVTQNKRSPY